MVKAPPSSAAPVDLNQVLYQILPSETDPAIAHFDAPNYVIFNKEVSNSAELVVFLPGTGGRPENSVNLLSVIANQGYRVIGLEYNDEPAVVQICPRHPLSSCSALFRQERIFGNINSAIVDNTLAESILNRLVKLIVRLNQEHPNERWGDYLQGDEPNWNRIVVSGFSQGAGMAAFIAKERLVARVVLFSSPWDFIAPSRQLAPWIYAPSVTPRERWFAEYHRREKTADLIARAYKGLQIPEANITVFDLDLPVRFPHRGDDPFHGSTTKLSGYAPQWKFLFGKSPQ